MMKKLLLLLYLLFSTVHVYSQTYGNEWIDYSQKYYSFKIVNTGVYKLDYSLLNASGIPLTTFTPENIQIFGRDREIPLHIEDGGDSSFDPGDYILLYAEKNDGWLDSMLYQDPNTIGNPSYSLFNDTINYFFTWNSSTTNLRYTEETDVNFTGYTPSNYILQKLEYSYHNFYNAGADRISHAASSFYKGGEGFGLQQYNGFGGGYTLNLNALTASPYTGGDAPLPIFNGISTTNSEADDVGLGNHHMQWRIGTSNYVLHDDTLTNYQLVRVNTTFPMANIASGITPLEWRIIDDLGVASDYQSLNYWSITYPKQVTLDGTYSGNFRVKNNSLQTKIRLDFSNTLVSNPIVFVLGDIPKKALLTSYNGGYSSVFSNSSNGVDQQVIIQDMSSVISVTTNLYPVNGTGTFTDFSLVNADSVLLMIYHPSLYTESALYQTYRQSMAGGGYNTLMANIEELYLQFGGGIVKHINGIRRFSHYMYNRAAVKPVGLFLIGKGVLLSDNGYPLGSPGSRTNAGSYALNLVPTFGFPASDAAITAGLVDPLDWEPLIPTGRISVSTGQELINYLNKIKQYEMQQDPNSVYSTEEKDWQKHVLHFGGGINTAQQSTFQGYLNSMQETIEGANFGGTVTNYYKSSSEPFDPNMLTDVTALIQNGVSIMTFFGHASNVTGFDVTIDVPENWHNSEKYPIVIGNSCYSGNMYANSPPTISEKFVNVQDGGAIAFIGVGGDGLDQPLSLFTNELYRQFSVTDYGNTLSAQIKSSIQTLQLSGFTNVMVEATALQMNLHGDPMLRLNWHEKPEIELRADRVTFAPEDLDLTVDFIDINIVLTNLGRSITDTFDLEIRRDFPLSSVDSIYIVKVPKLDYKDTITVSIPMQPNIGVGINTFDISADIPSLYDEQYDELNNNRISTTLFIDIEGIIPVIPYEFAVVPDDSVTVKASTINPIADFNTYRFEIDTTDLFNSPDLRYATVAGLGGVKEVNPSDWKFVSNNQNAPLVCIDSTVYFWRVTLNAAPYDWRESSFQYITGKSGWGQDHFFQFKKNDFYNIDYDRTLRDREFVVGENDTLESNVSYLSGTQKAYMNHQQIESPAIYTMSPAIQVMVFDPNTHIPWLTNFGGANTDHIFGNLNDATNILNRSMKFFCFPQTSAAYMDSLQSMIYNHVPDGHYVLIYSTYNALFSFWDTDAPELYSMFDYLGSDTLYLGCPPRPNRPFTFFCKKGDPSSVIENYIQPGSTTTKLIAPIPRNLYSGSETSTLIGPSSRWGNVYWKQDGAEVNSQDSTVMQINAFDINGVLQYQVDTLFTNNDSILNLNTIIDANLFPYIKLEALYYDTVTLTPAQIDRWHVLYDPVPEAAIDGSTQYTWIPAKDTLDEGEMVKFAVDIKNIFTIPMDSILIRYWIEDAENIIHPIAYPRQDSLLVDEVIRDTVEFSTFGYYGNNSLWVEVNPYVNGSVYVTDQPEQEHFNNLLEVPFYVNRDDVNPILDVTFDGRHILNGDIVSPASEIFITLKDDNPLLLMNSDTDTMYFGIYITDPLGVQRKIPFIDGLGNVVMQWTPADAQNKRFKITYPGLFEVDGKYTLLVQGSDRSGNLSGDLQYKITFEIVRESSITYLMNYPNPFSTSTRFVFTLTGSEVPEDIIIQIMTVTGKVVREITESELGTIYIGRNITQFDWNGTDEFGDPLANGVYLYRVKAQINGENIKHRETGGDQYFTKDFGKMYIMR